MSGTAAAREREAAEQLARTAEHERAVAAAGDQLPDWVTSLTWDPSRRYEQTPMWRVTVSSEVSALRFEESIGGADRPGSVWTLLRNHELVNACCMVGAGAALSPDLYPAQLADVFADGDQQVRDQLSKVEKIGAQRQVTLADIQADLAAGLSRVRTGTQRLQRERKPGQGGAVSPSRHLCSSAGHDRKPSVSFPTEAPPPRGVP